MHWVKCRLAWSKMKACHHSSVVELLFHTLNTLVPQRVPRYVAGLISTGWLSVLFTDVPGHFLALVSRFPTWPKARPVWTSASSRNDVKFPAARAFVSGGVTPSYPVPHSSFAECLQDFLPVAKLGRYRNRSVSFIGAKAPESVPPSRPLYVTYGFVPDNVLYLP